MINWPLFDLQIFSENIKLQIPTDQQLLVIADKFPNGEKDFLPVEQQDFLSSNWFTTDSPMFENNFLAHHWESRAQNKKNCWHLNFGIFIQNCEYPIGFMSIRCDNHSKNPHSTTGSWILPQHRGKGYATMARKAVVTLAFEFLKTERMISEAHQNNIASNSVSKKLGYVENGYEFHQGVISKQWFKSQLWLLEKNNYQGYPDIQIENFPSNFF